MFLRWMRSYKKDTDETGLSLSLSPSLSLSLFLSFFPTHTHPHALILLSLHALTTSLHHTHTWYTGPTLSLSCPLTFTHSSYPAPLQTHTILILPTHTHGTHSLTRTPSQRNAQTFFSYFSCWNIFSKTELGLKSFKLDQMLPVLLLLLLTPFSR